MSISRVFFWRGLVALVVVGLLFEAWTSLLPCRRVADESPQEPAADCDRLRQNAAPVDRPRFHVRQHGDYWILHNYVVAGQVYRGNESLTYTTIGEYSFLDNLEQLILRWRAPMSIALYACGEDFERTVDAIRYLHSCSPAAGLIAQFVTFHIFFHKDHMPPVVPHADQVLVSSWLGCLRANPPLPRQAPRPAPSYRQTHQLLYPINVARNIARLGATTHYVFPLDIELFPTANFAAEFLQLVKELRLRTSRSVFVLPIFEVRAGHEIPPNKTELRALLEQKIAIPFHESFALSNHAIPNLEAWVAGPEPPSLRVFETLKRDNDAWEPFYVTANAEEPLFDERFFWEGQYDKRIQADVLTWMDYDFVVLDKAFLVHRPGIKEYRQPDERQRALRELMAARAHGEYGEQLRTLYAV